MRAKLVEKSHTHTHVNQLIGKKIRVKKAEYAWLLLCSTTNTHHTLAQFSDDDIKDKVIWFMFGWKWKWKRKWREKKTSNLFLTPTTQHMLNQFLYIWNYLMPLFSLYLAARYVVQMYTKSQEHHTGSIWHTRWTTSAGKLNMKIPHKLLWFVKHSGIHQRKSSIFARSVFPTCFFNSIRIPN